MGTPPHYADPPVRKNYHVPGESPGSFESNNIVRDNLSREIGRTHAYYLMIMILLIIVVIIMIMII